MALILKDNPSTDVVLYLTQDDDDVNIYAQINGRDILIGWFTHGILQLSHNNSEEVELLEGNLSFDSNGYLITEK